MHWPDGAPAQGGVRLENMMPPLKKLPEHGAYIWAYTPGIHDTGKLHQGAVALPPEEMRVL